MIAHIFNSLFPPKTEAEFQEAFSRYDVWCLCTMRESCECCNGRYGRERLRIALKAKDLGYTLYWKPRWPEQKARAVDYDYWFKSHRWEIEQINKGLA